MPEANPPSEDNPDEGGAPVSAKIGNRNQSPEWGRAEGATLTHSPPKILNLKGFSTLRVAQKVRFELPSIQKIAKSLGVPMEDIVK